MVDPDPVAAIAAALRPSGLVPRGWLIPEPGQAPLVASGAPVRSICLIGHEGGGFWPVFKAWWQTHPDVPDPLDAWSRSVIGPVADALRCEAVYPSDQPWQPFQQWAMRAEALKASPLGMLIHPEFGLWHGYRGAILVGEPVPERLGAATTDRVQGRPPQRLHPCDECAEKPCLSTCPVGAFSGSGFAVADCRGFLKSDAGQGGCMATGCRARDACPVGQQHRYSCDQIRFHMTAFAGQGDHLHLEAK